MIGVQARVLREISPEEVTSNIYTMVDVLLHHIQLELQHGLSLQVQEFPLRISLSFQMPIAMYRNFNSKLLFQDLLMKASSNLAFFIWTHELLPLDILLLALIDRDDDPHALRIVV